MDRRSRRVLHGVLTQPRIWAAIVLAALAGCNTMRLARIPVELPGDWPMFAMTPQHVPDVEGSFRPPLVVDWDQDVQAGIGNGSPVLVDSLLFLGNLRGDLQCIHVRTGKKIGSATFGEAIQGSPVILGRTAYLAFTETRESLVAFDLVDGKATWKRNYGDIETSPLLLNHRLYVGNLEGWFFCIEPATGDSIWRFTLPGNTALKGIRSSAAGDTSVVVFGADDGTVYALGLEKGAVRWTFGTGAPVMAAPTIHAGHVYAGSINGSLYCLDLGSGALLWRYELGGALYGAALPAGELVFVGSTNGAIAAVRARDGSPVWKTDLAAPVNSMPLLAGGILYVGTLKRDLVALEPGTGKEVWRTELPGRVKTTPAAGYGRLFVATDEKEVLAFRSSTP